jgi:hypothetical protein
MLSTMLFGIPVALPSRDTFWLAAVTVDATTRSPAQTVFRDFAVSMISVPGVAELYLVFKGIVAGDFKRKLKACVSKQKGRTTKSAPYNLKVNRAV